MKRAIIMAWLTFVVTSAFMAVSVEMPYWFTTLFLPPIILVFVCQYFKPIEIIWVSLLCGLVVDVLGGFSIGVNILLMLVTAIVLHLTNFLSSKIYRRDLIYYVAMLSFVYRFVLLLSQFIVHGFKANFHLAQLFFGPLIDGLVSIPFYYVVVQLLALVKGFDRGEYFKKRIGYHQ